MFLPPGFDAWSAGWHRPKRQAAWNLDRRANQAEKTIGIRKLGLDFEAVVWMRVTSNRELARRLGVSETAVRRAEKRGRIRREADGSWEAAKVKAAWSDNTDQAQQRPARSGGRTGKHRTLKPVPEAALSRKAGVASRRRLLALVWSSA
jgi:hypothetical protein